MEPSRSLLGASLQVHRAVKAALRRICCPPHLATRPRARDFRNCVDPAKLRPGGGCTRPLGRCYSGIQQDVRREGEWRLSHGAVLRLGAKDFAPQQVRRLVGAVAAVVRGDEPPAYLDRLFEGGAPPLPAPPAPAEVLFLERVELGPAWGGWRSLVQVDAARRETHRARLIEEVAAACERGGPVERFCASLGAGATRAAASERLGGAAARGELSAIEASLSDGGRVEARNEYGQTALFRAAAAGSAAAVARLLELGADTEARANGGATPCLAASAGGHLQAYRLLEAAVACTDAAGPRGVRACDYAAQAERREGGASLPLPAFPPSGLPPAPPLAPAPPPGAAVGRLLEAGGASHPGAGSCTVDNALPPEALERLLALWRSLPVASKDKESPIERSYLFDSEGWLTGLLTAAAAAAGLRCVALPGVRFLHYPEPGGHLPPHVDLPRCTAGGAKSTHTFLLYLTGCGRGGETLLLEEREGDAALARMGGVAPGPRATLEAVRPREGRLLLMPHACPHAAAPTIDTPKLLVRGEVRVLA